MNPSFLVLALILPAPAQAGLDLASPEPIVLKTPADMPDSYWWGGGMSAGAQGRLAVKARGKDEAWVWGPGPGRLERVLVSEYGGTHLGLSPDGRFLVVGGRWLDKKRRKSKLDQADSAVWDLASGQQVDTVGQSADAVISADGATAAFFYGGTLSADTVYIRDMKTGKLHTAWDMREKCWKTGSMFQPWQCEGLSSAALSPDGSRLLLARQQNGGYGRENTVVVADAASGKKLRGYDDFDNYDKAKWSGAVSVAYSADGRLLAYSGYSDLNGGEERYGVVVREADSGAILWKSTGNITSLAFSPDGRVLVGTIRNGGPLAVRDAATGQPLAPPTDQKVGAAAFASDGSFLFLGMAGKPEILAYRLKGGAAAPVAAAPEKKPEPAASVDAPPAAKTKPDPDALAVVIGVERYRQSGIPAVEYAASDAKTVASYLTQSMGFDPKNVVLLTDEQATKTDLEKYLGPWLENRATAKSRVFMYYAGHGSPDPKSGDAYLMPYEADPSYTKTTGYPLKELYRTLASLPAKDVTVVLDSCFSGAGQRSVIAQGARPLVSVKTAAPQGATIVLAAAADDQLSGSYAEGRHGLMTYYLLKGLGGAADQDKDGGVTTRELYDYIRPSVEREARRKNLEQTPLLENLPAGDAGQVWISFK